MFQVFRKLYTRLVSWLPSNWLRRAGFGLLGYHLHGSKIGWGTRIDTAAFSAVNCSIASHNLFAGPMTVRIGEGTSIGSHNSFICGEWVRHSDKKRYPRDLLIGSGCLITGDHWFDVCGRVTIGNETWLAGRGSQIWTHGASVEKNYVTIGERCYIGSAVRFASGAVVGNDCVVALGAVVVNEMCANHALIGGVPAIVIRTDYVRPAALPP